VKKPNSKFHIPNSSLGFTLLELIIYITILALLSLAIAGVFTSVIRGQSLAEVQIDVNSNLRFAIERMSQDIRAASAVATPATPGGTAANTLVMTVSGTTITYCVAGNQLRRLSGAGTCDTNTDAITTDTVSVSTPTCPTSCIFTRLENLTGAPLNVTVISIKIDLTISNTIGSSSEKQFSSNKKTTVSLK
jgi:type II secretory pathway pseudopilin PulG